MNNYEKAAIGAAGGFAAVAVKFLGQDFDLVVESFPAWSETKKQSLLIGYMMLTPILMFLGALIAWASEEIKRLKLLAIAIAAPAMITTWSGGERPVNGFAVTSFWVSTAVADEIDFEHDTGYKVLKDSELNANLPTSERLKQGIGLFFGYGKTDKQYRVIVGSFKDRGEAEEFVLSINDEDASLAAFVGLRIPPNEHYPVFVGKLTHLEGAIELKQQVVSIEAVGQAYVAENSSQ